MRIALLSLALLLGVASPAEASRASLLAAEQDLVESIERAGPIAGFAPKLTRDAVYLHPGADAVTGRAAIRAQLQGLYPDPASIHLTLHPVAGDISHDGRAGFTFGWLEQTASGVTSYGKYIIAWKKQNHTWRIHAFTRNGAAGPPSTPPAGALILDGERGTPAPDLQASLRFQIMQADADFAQLSVDQGYTVAFSAYTAEAGVVVSPSDFFWDRAGVEVAFAGWTPAEALTWYPLRAEAAASGDLGWSIGYSRYSFDDGTSVQTFYSKYLTIWIRNADGSWKFLVDAGNPRPAPAP